MCSKNFIADSRGAPLDENAGAKKRSPAALTAAPYRRFFSDARARTHAGDGLPVVKTSNAALPRVDDMIIPAALGNTGPVGGSPKMRRFICYGLATVPTLYRIHGTVWSTCLVFAIGRIMYYALFT